MVCGSKQTTLDGVNLLKSLGYIEGNVCYLCDFIYEEVIVNWIFVIIFGTNGL